MTWIRIVSWHQFVTFTRAGQVLTRCGRRVSMPHTIVDQLPAGEKTCESCLRAIAIAADPPEPTNDEVSG